MCVFKALHVNPNDQHLKLRQDEFYDFYEVQNLKWREVGELQYTVEPPNKGHFGANSFVLCREVVPISEGPLSEVPLYYSYYTVSHTISGD